MTRAEAFHRTAGRSLPGALAATLGWLALAAPAVAGAATITVTTARDQLDEPATCSLRQAIQAAHENAAVGGCPAGERDAVDAIALPFAVQLTISGAGEDGNATGDLDVEMSASGPLRIVGTGAEPSTIAQARSDRVLDLVGGSLTLERVALTGGSAIEGVRAGGGVLVRAGTKLNVTASLITGNIAQQGGGIANGTRRVDDEGGDVLIESSTVTGNTATATIAGSALGAGVANINGTLTLLNSTVSGNAALGGGARGAGVYNEATPGFEGISRMSIIGSTIAANGPGANVFNSGSSVSAPLRFRSTIVADPRSGRNCGAGGGGLRAIDSQGYNLVDDDGCNLTAPTDQLETDPLLAPLADNGGPTPTHAPAPVSPAVDRGTSDTALPAVGPRGSDQRGLPRPVDFLARANAPGGDGADIGAFELQRLPAPAPAVAPPAPSAEAPSNRFRIVKVRKKRRRGIAVVVVRVPGPGRLALRRNGKVRPAAKRAARAGTVRLKVRPRGTARRRLSPSRIRARNARRARVRVRARITYTPAGGEPRTVTRKLRLVRRR
jgi:CSLREA domain-containing protein